MVHTALSARSVAANPPAQQLRTYFVTNSQATLAGFGIIELENAERLSATRISFQSSSCLKEHDQCLFEPDVTDSNKCAQTIDTDNDNEIANIQSTIQSSHASNHQAIQRGCSDGDAAVVMEMPALRLVTMPLKKARFGFVCSLQHQQLREWHVLAFICKQIM